MLPSSAPALILPRSRRLAIALLVLLLVGVALGLRLWQLNSIPPGLWWDEATQGLDAAELLHGQFRLFYPSALGKEPLYIYLTAPFVAAAYGQPFAVRIAGALLSVLMVPALYACSRALFIGRPLVGAWAGIAAALLWTTNFWAQSISRIGFQVNAFPLVLTAAVLAWLGYVRRPTRRRALTFGIVAGITFYTYLAARFTPALWLVLWLLLPMNKRRSLRPTLAFAVLALVLVSLPLGIHFALHPADFLGRINTFSAVQGPDASIRPESLAWSTEGTLKAFFGLIGDPIARHNLPDQPSFTVIGAALFAIGLIVALLAMVGRRDEAPVTVLVWWLIMCVPAILSRSSTPHYPRLYGALPAAILIAALPFGYLAHALGRWRPAALTPAMSLLMAALLVFEGVHTTQAYFIRWGRESDLYTAYQQDLWTVGEQVRARPGAVGVVPLHEGYGRQLDYAFADTPIFQLPADERDVARWLDARLGKSGGKEVVSVAWGEGANQDADPKQLLQHFLAREGELIDTRQYRGFKLETFRLGERPQLTADGQTSHVLAAFESDVTLQDVRWGAAYPNADRSAGEATAGTPLWVVLKWKLASAQPDLRTAVDLLDPAGHRLASAEAPLMDVRTQAEPWRQGDTVETYHLLAVPATQPPGPLVLTARLYNTKTESPVLLKQPRSAPYEGAGPTRLHVAFGAPLASQAIQPPTPSFAKSYNRPLQGGVTLLGANDWVDKVRPGEKMTLRLYWQVDEPASAPRPFELTLATARSGSPSSARSQVQIPAGLTVPAVVHTDVDLALTPDAELGPHIIQLRGASGEAFELGTVEAAGRRQIWEAPPVAQSTPATFGSALSLVGVTAPPTLSVAPGQTVTVTLVWKVLQPPGVELARFVHVLGTDGRPLAQRDGAPCAGWDGAPVDDSCPAAAWLSNEILVDTVAFVLPVDLSPGRYPLATGWYEPSTLARLPVSDARGERTMNDIFRLPVELVIH